MAYVDASLDCPFLWPMLVCLWIVHSCGLCWCIFGLSILVAYIDCVFGLSILVAYVDASLDCPFLWPMLMCLWIVHSCGPCWCVFGLSILVAYVDASLDCPFLWPMLMCLWIVHSSGLC